ncbi:MAG: lysine--tRNA ligase [Deltaproteobacteria bacterium]|nr:lysine--tRNA ligase [Deltaproteobacteria bacterium]MBW1993643.1 lysine--tRNA ligase [Deltaproteobacteria bacterium]
MTVANYKSWPFKEARKLQKRYENLPEAPVRFETGFGPSGKPHIGTFAEVARTTWVRHAFEFLTNRPTQLIAFSDDMDGLRKVPLNLPQQEMLAENLGRPLCYIPDPFGESESYSAYMNNKLREFLDKYNFDYSFQSSFQAYRKGDFNEGLTIILNRVEDIKAVILPTLSEEKRADWSPFFPICEKCGRIYSTRVVGYRVADNAIDYVCDREEGLVKSCGYSETTSILNGRVKVGWKIDWALRWYAYDIGYEMYGKDLIDSAKLSGKIVRIMGKQPPVGFFYELFLDEEGRKISKSVGKGLTIDAWTRYAPLESLLYFIFQNPQQAKRLYWGMVPKSVDGYLMDLYSYEKLEPEKRPDSTIWHLFNKGTNVPSFQSSITFSLINNLISAVGTDDIDLIMEYVRRYDPSMDRYLSVIEDLVRKAMNYYRDIILPNKQYRTPSAQEREMLRHLRIKLSESVAQDEKELQTIPFDVARTFKVSPKDFFKTFYEVVFGQDRGPRFGTFIRLVGKAKMLDLLDKAIGNE